MIIIWDISELKRLQFSVLTDAGGQKKKSNVGRGYGSIDVSYYSATQNIIIIIIIIIILIFAYFFYNCRFLLNRRVSVPSIP